MMTTFGQLLIGDKFVVDGKVWMKSKPKAKGCCKNKRLVYNAFVVGNKTHYRIFKPMEHVEKL